MNFPLRISIFLLVIFFASTVSAENVEFSQFFAQFAKIKRTEKSFPQWATKPSFVSWLGVQSEKANKEWVIEGEVFLMIGQTPTFVSVKTGKPAPWKIVLKGDSKSFHSAHILPSVDGIDPHENLTESLIEELKLKKIKCINEPVLEGNSVYQSESLDPPVYIIERWQRGASVADISYDLLFERKDAVLIDCFG